MNDIEEFRAEVRADRVKRASRYFSLGLFATVIFWSGFGLGQAYKPRKIIKVPPVVIAPEPPHKYPLPTREI